jgi:hypothetical protein
MTLLFGSDDGYTAEAVEQGSGAFAAIRTVGGRK